MKKILVLMVAVIITAVSLYAQNPDSEIHFDDCYHRSSVWEMIQYKINHYRTRSIEYDWKEFENVQYTQMALNYSVEGYITMIVNISKKGKVTKIRAINQDNKLLNEMAIIAINKATFHPAKKSWKFPRQTL